MGHFHGHRYRIVGLSGLVRRQRNDAARQAPGDQLFHAGHCRDGTTPEVPRRQSAIVSAPLLVLRPSRGLHRRRAGLRHCLRPDQHPCEKKHLRLSHDGVGDHRHRRPQFRRLGAPHVCERHEPVFRFFFATTTLIIAIPTAIKVYNWVLTLWRGDIHLTVPMLFALSFIVTFVNGGMTGLFLGNPVVDVPLSDTMFVVAHFHMVMGMAPIFVIFGAIYHWYPKVTGRMMNDMLGKFHFWVTFLGAYAIYFPMHYLGLLGVPRRYFEMGDMAFVPQSATTLNGFITTAALIVGFAQMVFLFNLIWSLFKGKPAGSNPWRATTLEWQTPETPPGHGTWGKELPVVYRWAYDYSVPGAKEDFIPQNQPAVPQTA